MKKLIIPCLFAVLIASAVNARAQRYETLSLPAVVAIANSPTNLATKPIIDVTGQQNVFLQMTVSSADSSSTTNVLFTLQKSADGIYWDTNAADCYTVTALINGTLKDVSTTNIAVGGISYLRVAVEDIKANTAITNVLFRYSIKPNAP